MNLDLFAFLSVWNARSLDHQVFLNLFRWSYAAQSKKNDGSPLRKKLRWARRAPKIRFLCFQQKSYLLRYICFFALIRKCQWFFNFLQKQHVWEKSGSWVMVEKPQGCNMLQRSWGMQLNFWMLVGIHESNKYWLVASSGCGKTCLDMLKLMINSELALSQEWLELWS